MTMNSRAIAQRSIARQDNAPNDTSLLWLDTNFDPAKLKQYNGSTSEWQSVASSVVTKQDTAPDAPVNGDLWQDTSQSPAVLKVYDAESDAWIRSPNQTEQNAESTVTLVAVDKSGNRSGTVDYYDVINGYNIEANPSEFYAASATLTFLDGTQVSVTAESTDTGGSFQSKDETLDPPKKLQKIDYDTQAGGASILVEIDHTYTDSHIHPI